MNNIVPRRVFIFDINGLRGGSSQSLRMLLNHMDSARYEIVLGFGLRGNRTRWAPYPVYETKMAGFDNYDFAPMSWNIRCIYHALRWLAHLPIDFVMALIWLRQIRPDLVHINVGQALAMGLAACSLRIPLLWHIREMVCPNGPGQFQQWIYRTCATRMVAISRAVAARLPACADKITVVPNSVDVSSPHPEEVEHFRRQHGLSPGRLVVLLLGGFQINKGYLFLSEVADRLASEPRVVFMLAGDMEDMPASPLHRLFRWLYRTLRRMPGERELIRSRWQRAVARGQAVFVGHVRSDLAIAAGSLVVCPNLTTEPFGRTVIEAYAQARPVLASAVPAFDEIIDEGDTGWMLPLDADRWASRLRELANDPERARAAGCRGRQKVPAFDGRTHAARIMDLYSETLFAHR